MDRSWISACRLSKEYSDGIQKFIEFARLNKPNSKDEFRCPCIRCVCAKRVHVDTIREHVVVHGFDKGYTNWIWHGEAPDFTSCHKVSGSSSSSSKSVEMHDDAVLGDALEEMINDVEKEASREPEIVQKLVEASEKPLYAGSKYTVLSAVLRLFKLKARYGWDDKSFSDLMEALSDMFPEGNQLPSRGYDAKKILCPLGMGYKKIHACPNDCILYRNEYENRHTCVKCGASRYLKKGSFVEGEQEPPLKGSPAKVVWYLPVIPRLRRLYATPEDARRLTWHADRKADGKLRHPADSPQWKMIDRTFSDFGSESRNIRFGLCTDGINPHGNLSSKHSSWPVLLVIYNLPPWLSMKRKYIMLSLMISGPKQPGNDIDVFLAPLIDDLKVLWNEGVVVFDAYRKEKFTLRAMIFCTINDFPAYGNLAGYSVKGHKACPICEENTCFTQLRHGRKTVYLGHRRFLPRFHPYRRKKKAFNGRSELEEASLEPLSGSEVYRKVSKIANNFGKTGDNATARSNGALGPWKKCSIFYELPYWQSLYVRHSLDVMHIEKNICDSLIGTLLNIPNKTKDGLNSRLDMMEMGIRPELAPIEKGDRSYLPPALHTLGKKGKQQFCACLRDTKVPQGFCSNIRSLVSMQDLKLVGLKSHDCHVLMQHLIPIAIRPVLPNNVKRAITNLCLFFKKICSHSIDVAELDKLQSNVVETVCDLEMFFPPSFFDIMPHLSVHITGEIKLCGPVAFRWMYPFERFMKVLKGYVRNRYRPEASMVESYITEEVLEFVTNYLSGEEPIGVPSNRHESSFHQGKGRSGMKVVSALPADVVKAHVYVLNNHAEVEPYLVKHRSIIDGKNKRMSDKWRQMEHNRAFRKWFEDQIKLEEHPSETLRWISRTPSHMVISYSSYDISGYTFHTERHDARCANQNSGVCVIASATHYSSSKDANPIDAEMPYYGVIEEIWDLDYGQFRIPVFKCRWFDDSKKGKYIDEFGFTLVNFNKIAHVDEPFVLASQAKQVFYKRDPLCKGDDDWRIVIDGCRAFIPDEDGSDDEDAVVFKLPSVNVDEVTDENFSCVRNDNTEGYWVDIPKTSSKS
jgi:hypothetical protein